MTDETPWKQKVQDIVSSCQEELKRTTEIGKKMLSASKTNSTLHDSYEELGVMVVEAIRKGELTWDNSRVKELINNIENCEQDLSEIEEEVNKIRFSPGPEVANPAQKVDSENKPAPGEENS